MKPRHEKQMSVRECLCEGCARFWWSLFGRGYGAGQIAFIFTLLVVCIVKLWECVGSIWWLVVVVPIVFAILDGVLYGLFCRTFLPFAGRKQQKGKVFYDDAM